MSFRGGHYKSPYFMSDVRIPFLLMTVVMTRGLPWAKALAMTIKIQKAQAQ